MSVNALPLLLDGARLALLCGRQGFEVYCRAGKPAICDFELPCEWTAELHIKKSCALVFPAFFVRGKRAPVPSYWFALYGLRSDASDSHRVLVAKWNMDMMNYLGAVPDEDFAVAMEFCS